MTPEEWNRVPQSIACHAQLSAPKVDILVGGNTLTIPHLEAGLHPLSLEVMQDLLRDSETREQVPLKSTRTHNALTMHDLFVIEIKDTGSWIKAKNAEVLERDLVMDVARNQVINANFVQLASMAELGANVPLNTDTDAPDLFVLGMTICGSEWTVEYATRRRKRTTPVSPNRPSTQHQCTDQLRSSIRRILRHLPEGTGRANPSTSCSWLKW